MHFRSRLLFKYTENNYINVAATLRQFTTVGFSSKLKCFFFRNFNWKFYIKSWIRYLSVFNRIYFSECISRGFNDIILDIILSSIYVSAISIMPWKITFVSHVIMPMSLIWHVIHINSMITQNGSIRNIFVYQKTRNNSNI